MEKLIIICTVSILAAGAIVSIVDAVHTHYQKKLMNIIKKQNDMLRKQNDMLRKQNDTLLENLDRETAIIRILLKSEEKSHE